MAGGRGFLKIPTKQKRKSESPWEKMPNIKYPTKETLQGRGSS